MAAAGARYSRPAHLIAPTNEGIDMLGFGLDRPRHEDRDDAASAPRSGGSRSGPSPPGPPRDPVPRAGDSAGASRQDLDAESFATARSDGLAGPAHVAGPPSRAMDDGDSHSARHAYGDGSADLTDAQSQSRSGSHRRASTLRVGSLQEATMPRPPHMRPLPRREDYNRALMQATTTSFVQSREDAATHRPGAADSTEFSRVSYSTVGHPPARSRARRGGASPGLQLESSAEEGSSGSDEVSRVRMEDEERGSGEVTVNADTASGARTPAKGSPPATASVDSKALGWDHAGSRQGGRVDAWLRWLVGRGKSEPAFAEACGSRVGASAAGSRAADGTVMMPPPAKTAFRPGIIDPRSQWLRNWELVVLLVLVYTATVTPYEVAFFQPAFNTLFLVNRLVDFTFFVVRSSRGHLTRSLPRPPHAPAAAGPGDALLHRGAG